MSSSARGHLSDCSRICRRPPSASAKRAKNVHKVLTSCRMFPNRSVPVQSFRRRQRPQQSSKPHGLPHNTVPRSAHRSPGVTLLTVSERAPLRFRPCSSRARLRSRSSFSHCSATAYNVGLGPRSTDIAPAVPPANGQAVGSIRKVPRCMCATCVGKLFKPSKMCVASTRAPGGRQRSASDSKAQGKDAQTMVAPRASDSSFRNVRRSSRTSTSRSTVTCQARGYTIDVSAPPRSRDGRKVQPPVPRPGGGHPSRP